MTRSYINSTDDARVQVERMVELVQTGKARLEVGLDVETAPIPGLVGYPGTVMGDDGKWVKADKRSYLEFAQRLFRLSFMPSALINLGLHIPEKTISGKEKSGQDAKVAWKLFLDRIYELERLGGQQLEAARWYPEALSQAAELLSEELGPLEEEKAQAEDELHNIEVAGGKGKRTWETALKRTTKRIETIQAELATLAEAAEFPKLDLRLITHVVKVGVEGRIYTSEGRNRLDPVKPGLDPHTSTVFLVQFTFRCKGSGDEISYIFNTHKVDIRVLLPLLKLKKVTWIGANIKFDLGMLQYHAGYAPQKVHCTRVASRMLYLGLKMDHSLLACAKRFAKIDITKEVRNDFVGRRYDEPTPEMLQYAYTDTAILHQIMDAQLTMAEKFGQKKLISDFSNLSWLVGAKWELEGFLIDQDEWLKIAAEAARARDEVARELEYMLAPELHAFDSTETAAENDDELFPDDEAAEDDAGDDDEGDSKPAVDTRKNAALRMSQTALVKEYLERLLGMGCLAELRDGSRRPVFRDGKVSLGKIGRSALEREYRRRHGGEGHPFFQKYALWSKLAKQASTYGKRFLWNIHPLTGRIHPTFTIAGTDTARFKSSGPNLLNIPAAKEAGDPDFRRAFIVPEGFYLLGADFETMEFRIAIEVFRDVVGKKMVESGADAHGFTAANMFHIRRGDVNEVQGITDTYTRGTMEVPITVFVVPKSWTDEQIAELALDPTVQAAVQAVEKKITRGDAKSVTFLWLFQGTAFTLAERTGLPQPICDDFFSRFANVYKGLDQGIKAYAEYCIDNNVIEPAEGVKYAYAEGYGGIRRYVELPQAPYYRQFGSAVAYEAAAKQYKRLIRRAQRKLCNLPMQGGNAVITTEALLLNVARGQPMGVFPWLSIYDEIIDVAPATVETKYTKMLLEGSMLDAADNHMTFVHAGAEANADKAGRYWKKS